MHRIHWTAFVLALLVAVAPATATENDVAPAPEKKPAAADKAKEPAKKDASPSTAAKPAADAAGKETDKDKKDAAAVDARFNTLEDVFAAKLASVECPPPAPAEVLWREVE